jgi:hypothetical protein
MENVQVFDFEPSLGSMLVVDIKLNVLPQTTFPEGHLTKDEQVDDVSSRQVLS